MITCGKSPLHDKNGFTRKRQDCPSRAWAKQRKSSSVSAPTGGCQADYAETPKRLREKSGKNTRDLPKDYARSFQRLREIFSLHLRGIIKFSEREACLHTAQAARMVRLTGVEPARPKTQDPKSCASANSATSACFSAAKLRNSAELSLSSRENIAAACGDLRRAGARILSRRQATKRAATQQRMPPSIGVKYFSGVT